MSRRSEQETCRQHPENLDKPILCLQTVGWLPCEWTLEHIRPLNKNNHPPADFVPPEILRIYTWLNGQSAPCARRLWGGWHEGDVQGTVRMFRKGLQEDPATAGEFAS